jgi:hypothetical protein
LVSIGTLTDYSMIFIGGWVHNEYGIWQSEDAANTSRRIEELPFGSLDAVKVIKGDQNITRLVYLGFGGSGFAYEAPTSSRLNGGPVGDDAQVHRRGHSEWPR